MMTDSHTLAETERFIGKQPHSLALHLNVNGAVCLPCLFAFLPLHDSYYVQSTHTHTAESWSN